MSRLMQPGLGELADRLSILALKILHTPPEANSHFHAEQALCQHAFDYTMKELGWSPTTTPEAVLMQMRCLRGANVELWKMEDQMARYATNVVVHPSRQTIERIAELGLNIWRHNRERNDRIREINRLAGMDHGPEKL